MDETHRALAIFAKLPEPGRVKTRLVPLVGEVLAAALAAAFLRDTVAIVRLVASRIPVRPIVFYDPPTAYAEIRALVGAGIMLIPQRPGDLSERLEAARLLLLARGFTRIGFVGADSPTMPPDAIERAFEALERGRDVALGRASDGGYYLIALRATCEGLFERIDWSTEYVLAQTVARVRTGGFTHELVSEWYDVDDAESLRRLYRECEGASPRPDTYVAALFAQHGVALFDGSL